jgi:hypothetical protein
VLVNPIKSIDSINQSTNQPSSRPFDNRPPPPPPNPIYPITRPTKTSKKQIKTAHPIPSHETKNQQPKHNHQNSTLDASYVSAASWMFLVAFGVKDLQRFFMREDSREFNN